MLVDRRRRSGERCGQFLVLGSASLDLLRPDLAVTLGAERILAEIRAPGARNNGRRLGADEPLQWFRAPIEDHPPSRELVRVR